MFAIGNTLSPRMDLALATHVKPFPLKLGQAPSHGLLQGIPGVFLMKDQVLVVLDGLVQGNYARDAVVRRQGQHRQGVGM